MLSTIRFDNEGVLRAMTKRPAPNSFSIELSEAVGPLKILLCTTTFFVNFHSGDSSTDGPVVEIAGRTRITISIPHIEIRDSGLDEATCVRRRIVAAVLRTAGIPCFFC
jgi:hypothetical protein